MRVKSSERVRAQWPCWRTVVATRFRLHAIFPITAIYYCHQMRISQMIAAARDEFRRCSIRSDGRRDTENWTHHEGLEYDDCSRQQQVRRQRMSPISVACDWTTPPRFLASTFPLILPFANSPTLLPRWSVHYRPYYTLHLV